MLGFDPGKRERGFRERIGIVLQEAGLDPTIKVREAIELYGAAYPNPRARATRCSSSSGSPTAATTARPTSPAASAAGWTSRSASSATPT